MSKKLFRYDLLISCPGDITSDELTAVENAVADFNATYEDIMGIIIRTRHWSKDSYSESGGKPQDLLNKQFVKDCDLTIALFGTRFGTPTDNYGSGTEEEIEIMLENGKQVFVGFSEIPVNPSKLASPSDVDEYNRVLAFKERYKNRGIFFTYSFVDDLKRIVYAHLSRHFIIQNNNDKLANSTTPNLSIQSIQDNKLQESIFVYNFSDSDFFIDPLDKIRELFKKVSASCVCDYKHTLPENLKPFNVPDITSSLFPNVTFDKSKQEFVKKVADALEIELTDTFFQLGELKKGITPIPFGGADLKGTDSEIDKYYSLHEINDLAEYWLGTSSFKKQYENLQYIKLAIVNNGTTFDEDIEITLIFHRNMLITHRELPVIDSYCMDKITSKHSIEDFFGIAKTAKYMDYDSTLTPVSIASNYRPPVYNLQDSCSDPVEDFYNSLESVFIYDYFEEGETIIMKFHVDYLKHNTSAGFPSIIFIRHGDADINYVLKSKHFKDEIIGKIAKSG